MYNRILKAKPYVIMLKKMDFWYWCKYFIDLYQKCPYSCSYCETRDMSTPSLEGLHIVPGLPNRRETIGLGLISDIYGPSQIKHNGENSIVSTLLSFLEEKNYPVNIVTKSPRILEDIDTLKKFAKKDKIRVTITILTLDKKISKEIEDIRLDPLDRLSVIEQLNKNGIPTGAAITPIIPLINDKETQLKELIFELKKRDAKWVLFSGFNPKLEFLNDKRWEDVKSLHKNKSELELRYKRVKQIIIPLLIKENLPIRIPRINLYKNTNQFFLNKITETLYNISYYYELLENRLESLRFRRAAYEIDKLDYPIKTLIIQKKLGYIKGINPEIENLIKEIVYEGNSTLYNRIINSFKEAFIGKGL